MSYDNELLNQTNKCSKDPFVLDKRFILITISIIQQPHLPSIPPNIKLQHHFSPDFSLHFTLSENDCPNESPYISIVTYLR